MMRIIEHFRGVIWPRPPEKDKANLYRYVVVGMIVTDQPIENLNGNEFVLDGSARGMADCLSLVKQKKASFQLGDANNVLCSLDHMIDET